ncbi:MAG: class I SAM-dependent methyltransferase [Labilithrix sp.]|nr:class I SAM-dependent methyltransferase [Labilithrix sp.]MCW5817019.1 class I SAM-dependent methyltransferase [Labilithrix sp.]
MAFAYDDVPYDTEACSEAHPVAMATIARLHGQDPAPARRARVLEIGCGDGENLIAAATYLPEATFVGFDLAAAAIEAGKAVAPPNVRLFAGDIMKNHDLGEFDYVVAHGLYSWVPPPVQAALLALTRRSLAPHGVAFLSMNALPGWDYRRALRELALDRVRDVTDPEARVRGALAAIAEIATGGEGAPGYLGRLAAAAASYLAHVEAATPPEAPFSRYVFHDLLAEYNRPVGVEELQREVAAHDLRVLGETPLQAPFTASALGSLRAFMAESELPFLQVLLVRDDGGADRGVVLERVNDLWLWADFAPAGDAFRTSTGALVRPPRGSGLERATRHAPGFVCVRELTEDDPELAAALLEGFRAGVFTLRSEPPVLGPEVAPHVRARARRGQHVLTNAIHRSFRVSPAELTMVRDATFDTETHTRFRRHLFLGATK